jgi:hypothetical protein
VNSAHLYLYLPLIENVSKRHNLVGWLVVLCCGEVGFCLLAKAGMNVHTTGTRLYNILRSSGKYDEMMMKMIPYKVILDDG